MKYGTRIVRLCAILVLSWGPNLLTAEEPAGPLAGQPTEQEILRCRLFEEALVPIGANPLSDGLWSQPK